MSKGRLAAAVGSNFKGKISLVFYLAAIPMAFLHTWIAFCLYILVAVMWRDPNRRIERVLSK